VGRESWRNWRHVSVRKKGSCYQKDMWRLGSESGWSWRNGEKPDGNNGVSAMTHTVTSKSWRNSYFSKDCHPSFFWQAVRLDDAFDAPGADGEAGLAELLGDDVDGGVGVEEAVANDLTLDLVGADVVGFGTTLLVLESQGALFFE
jgi:hypothetical protein